MHAVKNKLWFAADLHNGDGSPRDDWTPQDREHFLLTLPDGRLILAGDVLDFLRFGRGVFNGVNEPILKAFAKRRAIYVRGNHCPPMPILAEYYPRELICDMFLLGRILIIHGHQGDLLNGRFHAVGDAIVRVGNSLGRISPRLEDWAAKAAGRITAKGRYSDAAMVRKYAVEFAAGIIIADPDIEYISANGTMCPGTDFFEVDCVVCGHTHIKERGVATVGNRHIEYINCGCWKRGELIWTEI